MTRPKRGTTNAKPNAKRPRQAPPAAPSIRPGGERIRVRNSGLEVWLYDESNRETIRRAGGEDQGFGGMPPRFYEQTKRGLVVGYSLQQDDEIEAAIVVGDPLTDAELSSARWLEPQTAFLRLPSGALCIESNDASRLGPEDPTETGATVKVPAGDFRLTLYRIDQEALDREGLKWDGPREVIVLTPGGSEHDAADNLLPFELRRDASWIGKYTIAGRKAGVLIWFGDYWDTFIVNLDQPAASKLSIATGSYLHIHVPDIDLTLLSAFAHSWDEGRRLPPPAGFDLNEYGYAAFSSMSEWNGAEALFCRRDMSKSRVEDSHQTMWLPATLEVLDAQTPAAAETKTGFQPADLRIKNYFDPGFLSMILSEVLPEAADRDDLEWSEALAKIDEKLGKLGLAPGGDLGWEHRIGPRTLEMTMRLYTGLPEAFCLLLVAEGSIELVLLSEMDDGSWVVTGLADELERRTQIKGSDGVPRPNPRVRLENIDESVATIQNAHKTSVRTAKQPVLPAPGPIDEATAALERFLKAAFDGTSPANA